MGFVFPRDELLPLSLKTSGLLALVLNEFQRDEEMLMNLTARDRRFQGGAVELFGSQLNAYKPRKGATTPDQAETSRLLAKSKARYFRKDHTVRDGDGNIVFTGTAQIRTGDKYVERPSINAAKRWIREQVGLGAPISINV